MTATTSPQGLGAAGLNSRPTTQTDVRVILLATGEERNLPPLTDTMPAPMVPVVNRPVLEHNIEMLARQGFKNLIIALYHLGGSIEAYFGSGRRWGVTLDYRLQRDAWGSAGALKWSGPALDRPFLVLPGDRLVNVDLQALAAHHERSGATVTVVTSAFIGDGSRRLQTTDAGRVVGPAPFAAGPDCEADIGVYACDPAVLNYIPARQPFDMHRDLLPALLSADRPVHTLQSAGYWNGLGSFPCYQQAQQELLAQAWTANGDQQPDISGGSGLAATVPGHRYGPGIWAGRNNIIHPSVRFVPPVCIGDNCQIGRDVELGPNTVIGTNVIIGDEATVRESTIFNNTYVGQLVNVDNRFVRQNLMIDAVTAENIPVSDTFLLSESNPEIVGDTLRRLFHTVAAAGLLLLAFPLLLLIALLRLLRGGPVFSRESVIARPPQNPGGGPPLQRTRTFDLFLFAPTPWLTRLELRRLPSLWNVIKGDLALVGVKPLTPGDARLMTEEWQLRRYDYLAGFTGLWYVQTAPGAELDEILIADAFYVATRSWQLDLRLLWRTLAVWLRRRRA